ncbi:MAG: hypothetical protein QM783_17685 [Phycisphaerales bacterium]
MNRLLVSAVVPALVSAAALGQSTIYSNIPSTLAGNYPSQAFQATATSEFGDRINFGGTDRLLQSATITMSSWALSPDGSTTFDHALTLNIYAAGTGGTPGALLGTVTQVQTILYRPANWPNPNGGQYGGIACNVTFDLSGLNLTAPDSIVWGLAFNTQTYGANPIGADGPWNSLNVALNTAAGGGITVGSNDNLNDAFVSSTWSGNYFDGGAGGLGSFRQDDGWWDGYTPMISFSAVPTPGAAALAGLGGIAALRRRRR